MSWCPLYPQSGQLWSTQSAWNCFFNYAVKAQQNWYVLIVCLKVLYGCLSVFQSKLLNEGFSVCCDADCSSCCLTWLPGLPCCLFEWNIGRGPLFTMQFCFELLPSILANCNWTLLLTISDSRSFLKSHYLWSRSIINDDNNETICGAP